MENQYEIHELRGNALEPWLEALGSLRIRVFREYPYLYVGSQEYEREYLRSYIESPNALVVIVSNMEGEVIGATTCLPMVDAEAEFQKPFVEAGYDIDGICYFGESVLLPGWRGRGIGKRFFDLREVHAAGLGCRVMTFCAVDRPDNHPRRPHDYRPLDGFWKSRGYEKRPGLVARFPWREIGEEEESEKNLTFWVKGSGDKIIK